MGLTIKMPMMNVNDEAADLVQWLIDDGVKVKSGEILCVAETTKSTFDIVADADGFLRQVAKAGTRCLIGQTIGYIANTLEEDVPSDESQIGAQKTSSTMATMTDLQTSPWTMKAKILAERLGVDLVSLAADHPGETLVEDMVRKAADNHKNPPVHSSKEVDKKPAKLRALLKDDFLERVLILGGGGGAALVLDILSRINHQKAVGILDNNLEMAGNSLMGIPVLGQFNLIESLWRDNAFDVLISTVVRDVKDRAAIFECYTNMGIPFANIIDPEVRIGREVQLGSGNLIIYGSYLAANVKLGDNNFLAAGTSIEHHSTVGSHCTFGPRVSLSGKVSVGDKVKFGTQVGVEPNISIGAESIIASGVILTSHIAERSIVKSAANQSVRRLN